MEDYRIKLPCDYLPAVLETAYSITPSPMLHCDRTAEFHIGIYLIEGFMEIIENNVKYVLSPGEIFFLKKGFHHWGETPFSAGTRWYYVHFYAPDPEESYRKTSQFSNKQLYYRRYLSKEDFNEYITLPKSYKIPQNLAKIYFEKLDIAHNSGKSLEASIILLGVFLDILNHPQEFQNNYVTQIRKFVEENYTNNFSMQQLSKKIGLSSKYAETIFKNATGITIKQHQINMRMQLAQNLLTGTNLSIEQISAQCGFQDIFYFSKTFKKRLGITPSSYRKTNFPKI